MLETIGWIIGTLLLSVLGSLLGVYLKDPINRLVSSLSKRYREHRSQRARITGELLHAAALDDLKIALLSAKRTRYWVLCIAGVLLYGIATAVYTIRRWAEPDLAAWTSEYGIGFVGAYVVFLWGYFKQRNIRDLVKMAMAMREVNRKIASEDIETPAGVDAGLVEGLEPEQ